MVPAGAGGDDAAVERQRKRLDLLGEATAGGGECLS